MGRLEYSGLLTTFFESGGYLSNFYGSIEGRTNFFERV